MSLSEVDQKYANWIQNQMEWLCLNSTKVDKVRIYAGAGILSDNDDKEMRSCAGSEKEKFAILYGKVKESGFSKIDVIIRALEETKQHLIAKEFKKFKADAESSDELDFPSNETPLTVQVIKSESSKYPFGNKQEDGYNMSSMPRGLALIIHNENYSNYEMKREGATNDLHYTMTLFKQLNYKVAVNRDVALKELDMCLTDFQNEFKKSEVDSCVVICMGHGENQEFIMVDGRAINIWTELIYKFDNTSCPQLINKPKIFIFQACQMFNQRTAMDSAPLPQSQPKARVSDMLVCFSTIPGYPSYRDTYLGSWYIYCLTEIFMNHAHNKDIEELLRMTNKRMGQIRDSNAQVSACFPISFKKFYFNV